LTVFFNTRYSYSGEEDYRSGAFNQALHVRMLFLDNLEAKQLAGFVVSTPDIQPDEHLT